MTYLKIGIRLIYLLSILTCTGCSHQQTVTKLYPFWGEAVYLNVPGSDARRSLQLLVPKQAGSVRGCLLLVHGMNEHIGRFGSVDG